MFLPLGCVCIQSCLPLCDPMDCHLPGSSVRGILQARILEWFAIPFSRGSSQPKDGIWVSCIGRRILCHCATRESLCIYACVCVCVLVAQPHPTLCSSIDYIAWQAPLSMGFSRLEYWSGLPFPSPGDLPDPGSKLASPVSPALAGRYFTIEPPGKPLEENSPYHTCLLIM